MFPYKNGGLLRQHFSLKSPYEQSLCFLDKHHTVDDWLEAKGQLKVDFVKIDVDGPEPEVLQGMIRTFKRNPKMKMIVEFYPKYIKGAGCSPEKFMEILNKYFTYTVIPDDYTEGCWNYFCTRKC